jgi:beta-xylosidase
MGGRYLFRVMVAAVVAAATCSSATPAASAATGDFPDPFVLPVDGGYLAVATSPTGSLLNIPLSHSTDLQNWSEPTEALPSVAAWARPASVWAPSISSPSAGQWRLYYAIPHAVTRKRCVSVATSVRPEGPYVDHSVAPLTCDDRRGGAIDPEVFHDAEGRRWLLWKTEGGPNDIEAALWSQQLDDTGTGLLGDRRPLLERQLDWELPLIENPSMVVDNGRILLFYSAGLWQNETYKVGVARCHSPAGPCQRLLDHPVLSTRPGLAGPGGASVFRDRAGRLRMAFHAWSPSRVGYPKGGARSLHVAAVDGRDLAIGAHPQGSLDEISRIGSGQLRLRGWSADADAHAPVDVHVYVDGQGVASVEAVALRPDVERAHPGTGAHRGFESIVRLGPGPHHVCAYGINVGLGANSLLGCATVA